MKLKKLLVLTIFLIASIVTSNLSFAQENLGKTQTEESTTININTDKRSFETPAGYNDNDYQKLVAFLEAPSSTTNEKNGYQLNYNYDPINPDTWTGITWIENSGIKKVKEINMYNKKNITGNLDLAGFSELQALNCSLTAISNLNLTGLSNLKILYCIKTKITSLELAGLSNLQVLQCNDTGLSSLDLIQLSNLETLYCSNTEINNLDLTGLSNLKNLHCYDTKISHLNLTGLSNLDTLECNDTGISNLDLTGLSNLKNLKCSNTKINSLDLAGVSNLQFLNCSNTEISNLDLKGLSNLKLLNCSNCKLNIYELKKLKSSYPNLFKDTFLQQNIFDSYLYMRGDIKKFGSETSTYKWYIDGKEVNLSTSAYNFFDYVGKKVKCEITDGDITLISGETTITDIEVDIKLDNPPKDIIKGSQIKLSASVEAKNTNIDVDKSVSWSVYNSTTSTISMEGMLNVPLNEVLETITVRATSNFDIGKYAEAKLNVLSHSEIDLKPDKISYNYGDIITLNASVKESKAKIANSNEISFYKGDTLLGTKKVVNNQAIIQIDTKDLGIGTFNFKADFSGSDNFLDSTANINITVDKVKLNSPTGVKWNGMIAIFDAVENSSGYELEIFKKGTSLGTQIINTTSYDCSEYFKQADDYTFKVKAVGNEYYNDSEAVESDTYYYRLQSAISLNTDKESYTYGEVITLSASVDKSKARALYSNEISFYNGDKLLGTKKVVDNQASIQIGTKDLGVGTFNIKANFSGSDIFSDSTATIDVTVDKAKLNSPMSAKWNGMTATFDAVDNCSGYELEIFKKGTLLGTQIINTTSYDCSEYFKEPDDYTFKIKAIGNEYYNDSEVVESDIYYYRLQSVINLNTDKGSYTYGDVIKLNASVAESKARALCSNEISFYNGDKLLGTKKVVDSQASIEINTKDLSVGTFNIKANFSGSDIFSDSTATIDITVGKTKLNSPTGAKWNGMTATFDAVDNCSGYELEIFKKGTLLGTQIINTISYDCSEYFKEPDDYTFKVKSIGNEYYNDSEAVESGIYYYRLQSAIDLKTDKGSYTYGDVIKLNASVAERKARALYSNEISFYNGDKLLGTKKVVDNQASIQIGTKDLGVGTFNIKANFSGSDIFSDSTATIDVTVDKAKLNSPMSAKWNGMIATFNKVENCSGYKLQLFIDDKEIKTLYSDLLEYDFTKNFVASGDYSFSVKALGNDKYTDSQAVISDIYKYSNTYYDSLRNAIKEGKKILDKEDANVDELIEAIIRLSGSLKEFEANKSK